MDAAKGTAGTVIVGVENLYCRVRTATDAELDWLRRYLTVPSASPTAAPQSFLHLRWRTFPAGFLAPVRRQAARDGVAVEALDRRPRPRAPDLGADLGWLRDYQRDAAMALLRGERGLLWASTGSGKTEVIIALARLLPWARFLVLVHRKDLMEQTARRYQQRTGEPAGRVGDGLWEPARFTCATFQTLYRALEANDPRARALVEQGADAVVVDEVHVMPARSFWRVVMRARAARFRWGVSGTPLQRTDQRDALAIAALGPVLYRVRAQVLIDAGVLSRPRIRMVPIRQAGLTALGSWREVYRRAVVESARRNDAVLRAVARARKPCLLFVKEIAHGKALAAALEAAGLRVEFVWGAASLDRRRAAARRACRGDTDVVVASVIWQEGIDLPELRSVVVASGGRSVIATLQRLGRGARIADGKCEFDVVDFADSGHRWLSRHTHERVGAYVSEGYEVNESGDPGADAQKSLTAAQSPA